MKIIEYQIIGAQSRLELNPKINELIKEGWQPYGSLVIDQIYLFQPMVRYEESKPSIQEVKIVDADSSAILNVKNYY